MDIIHTKKQKGEVFKILGETKDSQVAVMTILPNEDSGPEDTHKGDQILYIIEGKADIELDGETGTMEEGDALIIPAGMRHHIYNRGMETLFFFTCYAPPSY
jgi:mannose-6-phosphate isomerase-like protein (cupin superfamily)